MPRIHAAAASIYRRLRRSTIDTSKAARTYRSFKKLLLVRVRWHRSYAINILSFHQYQCPARMLLRTAPSLPVAQSLRWRNRSHSVGRLLTSAGVLEGRLAHYSHQRANASAGDLLCIATCSCSCHRAHLIQWGHCDLASGRPSTSVQSKQRAAGRCAT